MIVVYYYIIIGYLESSSPIVTAEVVIIIVTLIFLILSLILNARYFLKLQSHLKFYCIFGSIFSIMLILINQLLFRFIDNSMFCYFHLSLHFCLITITEMYNI